MPEEFRGEMPAAELPAVPDMPEPVEEGDEAPPVLPQPAPEPQPFPQTPEQSSEPSSTVPGQ
jgi:hypothetical protein